MNIAVHSQPPPLAELVRAISEEVPVPFTPAPLVVHLPRPHPLSRLLVITAVLLCALLAVMLFGLTRHVQSLMADIRIQEAQRANPLLAPLPARDRLLNASTFAIDCASRPADAGRLHAARAQALVIAGRPQEAIVASQLRDLPLAAADSVALGEALFAIGHLEEARSLLLRIDVTVLNEEQRARGNDILGRVMMVQRQAERSRSVHAVR